MRKIDISYYLKNLDKVNDLSDQDLDDLLVQYPYMEALHLLKAKKEINKASPDINVLAKAALISSDRSLLYFNLMGEDLKIVPIRKKASKKKKTVTKKTSSNKKLTKPALKSTNQKEPVTPIEKTPSKVTAKRQKKTAKSTPIEPKQSVVSISPSVEEPVLTPNSFTEWLAALQKAKTVEQLAERLQKEDNEEITPAIQDNAENDSPLKELVGHSVEVNENIVSEPLADLLVTQGHYKRAREMYEKLSLIFPEKSAYFAGQIEKLNKR